jgi:hypothetical protein
MLDDVAGTIQAIVPTPELEATLPSGQGSSMRVASTAAGTSSVRSGPRCVAPGGFILPPDPKQGAGRSMPFATQCPTRTQPSTRGPGVKLALDTGGGARPYSGADRIQPRSALGRQSWQ